MRRVTVPPAVIFKNLGTEAIALNLDTGQYYGLDEMATRFWTLLTTSGSIEETHSALLAEFSVNEDQLRDDLEDFLTELRSSGLLEIHQE